ncbi:MAG TPA: CoA pyrophosphatase [Candidatus Limnocylindrales bacterium]|nr:CoA pyrophosphatase [Candidatus Limnocylindrales bacterium]
MTILPNGRATGLARDLARHLKTRERQPMIDPDAVCCAVLIPLLPIAPAANGSVIEDYDVVYTLRSEDLPSHKGQVAFPGGKRSGDEELLQTALRESSEEIGIVPSDVEVIGCLDDVSTMAGQFVITPWVGLLPPGYRFKANPFEVADIFTVRLSELANPRHHAQTTRQWNGNTYDISIITAGRHEIWGATHQITTNFLDLIKEIRRE